jgi:tryptophan halogenase
MVQQVQNIVIVGGGTAGWLAASVIAARHQGRINSGTFSVTLVESPDIRIVGVGEATWPTMRQTLKRIGVSETDFFRNCDASFKQGAKFAGWVTGQPDDAYYHPLMLPLGFSDVNLVPHWVREPRSSSYSAAVCPQEGLCEAGLAPKMITTPEYQAVANYAYHFDTGKLGPFLQKHCVEKLGVRHVLANVTSVNMAESGDIKSLVTRERGVIPGDLFVDCTGFAALLIGKALGVGFKDCNDVLFCDTALAVNVPYDTPDAPVPSHTIKTAQSAGWIWDIALATRRGIGHTFSSRHVSLDQAEQQLRDYIGPALGDRKIHKIPIRPGYRETFWKNNCVAVGLAAGFFEPLESSSIVLIELSARLISEKMPACREIMDNVAARFNEITHYRYGRILDFLKLHYILTQRTDTQFWVDICDPNTVPERLKHLLELWKYQPPWFFDEFDRLEEVFPAASYQYVMYGMGFKTEVDPLDLLATEATARRRLDENAALTRRLLQQLPTNRELLRKIGQYGMQPV